MWFPILILNTHISRNSAPLRDTSLLNMNDLEFHFSGSLSDKSDDTICLTTDNNIRLLLMYNSNHIVIYLCLPVTGTRIFSHISCHYATPTSPPHTYTLSPGAIFFLKIKTVPPWVRGKASTQNKVDSLKYFLTYFVIKTRIHTECPYMYTDTKSYRNKLLAGLNKYLNFEAVLQDSAMTL